jgi:hypothetical protein
MTTPTTKLAVLPRFPGFYESILTSIIDREMEYEMQESGDNYDEIEKRFDYGEAMESVARGWVQAFAQETGVPVEFESLKSPRQYNFTTDRVYVLLPESYVIKMREEVDPNTLRSVVEKYFTSCDGFISHYSPDIEDDSWKRPVTEWDHNELMALLDAWLTDLGHDDWDFEETLSDNPLVYESAQGGWKQIP